MPRRSRSSAHITALARYHGAASWPDLVHRLAEVPLVPARGVVVFPGQRIELSIGRARSRAAIDAALASDHAIVLVAQRAAEVESPTLADLHEIGTLGRVIAVRPVFPRPQQAYATVEGLRRVRLARLGERDGMLVAETSPIDSTDVTIDGEAAKRAAALALDAIARQRIPQAEIARAAILPHLSLLPTEVQQQVLETDDPARWVAALAAAVRGAT